MALNNYLDNSELAERIFIANEQVVNTSFIHKFGAVPAMSQNTTGTIWDKNDTLYPWSAFDTPGVLTIATTTANGSTSSLDDGKSVTILGLDPGMNPISETITITGSSGTGTKSFARVYRAYTSASNLNQIRVSRGATEVLRINISKSQTLMCIYTVPRGHTAFLTKGVCTAQAGADGTGQMFVRYSGEGAFRIGHQFEVAGGGEYTYEFTVPIRLPEKTDVDVRLATRSNNGSYTACFDVILVKNNR